MLQSWLAFWGYIRFGFCTTHGEITLNSGLAVKYIYQPPSIQPLYSTPQYCPS
jgi:hypothetical protein